MKRRLALGLAFCLIAGAAAAQDRAMTVEEMEEAFGLRSPAKVAPAAPAAPGRKPRYRAPTFEFGGPSAAAEPEAQASSSPVVINSKPPTGIVSMPIEFTVDSAQITPGYLDDVQNVAELMRRNPSLALIIRGHTDATGDASHNQALSQQRATAVRSYLINQGVSPGRLKVEGRGERNLLPGEDPEGAKNRRVEFIRSDPH